MNKGQEDDSYGHRTDTMDIPEPDYETVSGPVYINQDTGSRSKPVVDELYLSSGEEHIGDYPEGSYQTWSSRQQDEFGVEDDFDAVKHFFSEDSLETKKVTDGGQDQDYREEPTMEDVRHTHTDYDAPL